MRGMPPKVPPVRSVAPAISPAAGVTVDRSSCWRDKYIGSAECLIAAGIITAEQLPGQPGGPKVMATFYDGVRLGQGGRPRKDEHYLHIVAPNLARPITVTVGLSPAESARRRACQREAERAAKQAEGRLTLDEYRQTGARLVAMLWCHASAADRGQEWSHVPFQLGPDARVEMARLTARAIELFNRAEVVPATGPDQAYAAAQQDSAFQDFLLNQGLRQS